MKQMNSFNKKYLEYKNKWCRRNMLLIQRNIICNIIKIKYFIIRTYINLKIIYLVFKKIYKLIMNYKLYYNVVLEYIFNKNKVNMLIKCYKWH